VPILLQVPESEPWWFKGAQWADADVQHLRKVRACDLGGMIFLHDTSLNPLYIPPAPLKLMRHVYENPHEVATKGKAARKLMLSKYSPDIVGRLVAAEVERIKGSIR